MRFGEGEAFRSIFPPERLQRIARMEAEHFWFVGRRMGIARWLRAVGPLDGWVLDAGCGTGAHVQWLARQGLRPLGLDLLADGLRGLRAQEPVLPLIQGSAERMPFRDGAMAMVLFLDVLEHLDDRTGLREAFRVLSPGGWLLLSAPAMPWLWSARDVAAGHRRRYTHRTLEARLREAGFQIVRWQRYPFFLFPWIVATRILSRIYPAVLEREERPGRILNAWLTALVQMEVTLGRWIRWPLGSTLLVLARKPISLME
ncbi:MAG: methyltransferase domain-containing protein [Anaerolineae bacterium]|nr:methyltransferase domain-containing protein [Anaerolineae bacterium]